VLFRSGRGLAYWSDGRDERIFYVTPGFRLICLDAKTGQRVPSFGEDGIVDLKLNDDQTISAWNNGEWVPDLETGEIGIQSAPVVAKDTVIVGAAFREGMTPRSMRNNKGYVRGFDVRTGKRLWIFHTIPKKGEFGYDTWEKGSAEYTGNTGVWTQITVDEQLGLVYLPVESPTSDFYGGHRPGNNLFGESLVCVDLKTGERKWHFQLVHHALWDMDISSAPILADITGDGKQTGRPAWHAHDGNSLGRHQLARRIVRSRNAQRLRLRLQFLRRADRAGPRSQRSLRHRVHRRHRRERSGDSPRSGRERRSRFSQAAEKGRRRQFQSTGCGWIAPGQAAIRHNHSYQS